MKFVFLLYVLFFIDTFASAQEKKNKLKKKAVPVVVVNAFDEKFLNAKKTTWHKEEQQFLAVCYSDGLKLHALYNSLGAWQETHLYIQQLPVEVIKTHYGGFYGDWSIRKKVKVELSASNYYLLEVHFNEMIRELIYDESGNLVKEKIINQ